MTQITSGIRSVLSLPSVYSAFQDLLGAPRARRAISDEYIRATAGDVVIDIGCGPGDMLDYLDAGVEYHGFDLSDAYVEQARARHGSRGSFACADVATLPQGAIPPCNIAMAIGLLHHLDDDQVASLLSHIAGKLAPGGRLITVDPAFWEAQATAARWLISKDRGRNVRHGPRYAALASDAFSRVVLHRRDDLLNIPYTHAIMECTR